MDGEQLKADVERIVAAYQGARGPLLPILHDLHAEYGYIPPDAIALLAHALNLSRAEVWGVLTFYKDFRQAPAGAQVVRLCRAEACQAMGGRRLADHVRARFGIEFGETTADGLVTLDAVYCLGNCALGPSAQIDGNLVGRVDPTRFDSLVTGNG